MFNFNSLSKILFVFFLLVSCFAFISRVRAQVAIQDSLALVDLYNSTNGSEWEYPTNWLTGSPVNSWSGVNVTDGRVTGIVLLYSNLNGVIPASIANLTAVQYIVLAGGKLRGPIPTSIFSLSPEVYIDFFDNSFTFSDIEPLILHFKHVTYNPQSAIKAHFSDGILSASAGGAISNNTYTWYGLHTGTETIIKGDSTFIPPNYDSYYVTVTNSICKSLILKSDTISYPIPQISESDSLALVDFFNNTNGQNWKKKNRWLTAAPASTWHGVSVGNNRVIGINLSYSLADFFYGPTQFTQIFDHIKNFSELQFLDLSVNTISGSFPSVIDSGTLSKLKILNLSNIDIIDTIPETIYNLKNLEYLDLSNNPLRGNIPPLIGNLTNLKYLNLRGNFLPGNIPESIVNLTNLWFLDLSQNKLTGSIPSAIGNLTNLQTLCLFYNQLTGPIPESIGNLSKLPSLSLLQNQLSGSIPDSIGKLLNLQALDLSANYLTGSIPESIGNLRNLKELNLYNNSLSGSIPKSIENLSTLHKLDLAFNQLTGEIPSAIGNLISLDSLFLGMNQLSGNIPPSIGNLSELKLLSLWGNKLSGQIPDSLKNLPRLLTVYFHTNQLSGLIPFISRTEHPLSLFFSNNKYLFSDIEPLLISKPAFYYEYSPQGKIPVSKSNNLLTVSVGGTLANNTYKWYNNNTLIAIITNDSSFVPSSFGKYSVAVSNSVASQLILYSDTILVGNLPTVLCNPEDITTLNSNISGSNYQWQVSSDGILFGNISNNSNYTGANSANLQLINIPSSFYGYQYRCVADGNNSGVYTLQFKNSWLGSPSNNDWKTASNWSCSNVPDANTDVIINSGNIVVTENASCRSLTVKPTATVTVNPGVTLSVLH